MSNAPARAATLIEDWIQTPGGSPEGSALGDVDGDGRYELAVVLRGGTWNAGAFTPGAGSLVLLNYDGTLRFQVQTGQQLAGFPTFADFDGDSFDEVAFCEVSDVGKCYVYDGDGSLAFATSVLWFPAMTNGGPVAADIDGDGYQDLIVTSSAGEVKAFRGPSGALAWSYDLYTAHADWPFGHAAVGDIDGDKKFEIAIGGAQRGGIYVLNAEDGTEQWVAADLYATYNNYFYGAGPILANLDTDAQLEIVAAMAGYNGPSALLAFESNGAFKWRTTAPSEDFLYTSPASADIDADGKADLLVQAFSGNLLKYRAADGVLVSTRALGAESWSSPAFLDVNFDGTMEVVTSTLSAAYILNGSLAQLDKYDNPNAGLFPPPVIGDTDADGTLDMVTGAWYPQQLVSIPLPYTSAFSWSTFQGSAKHAGSVPAATPSATLGDDPAQAAVVLINELVTAVASTTGTQRTRLTTARGHVDTAYRDYLRGNPHLAIDRFRQAVSAVQQAGSAGYPAASVTHLQQELVYSEILMFSQYIDRTAAIVGLTKSQVVTARNALTTAQTQYDGAQYTSASQTADDAALALRNFLDTPSSYTVGNYCPMAVPEVYMAWECRINQVRDQVKALLVTYPGSSALTSADANLRTCVAWAPDLVFSQAYGYCKTADQNLAGFTPQSAVSLLRTSLAFAIMRNTRLYVDDATTWFKTVDPSALTTAESHYGSGVAQYDAGSHQSAHQSFINAYTSATPCSGSSFASPPNGLTAGGCRP